MCCMKVPSNDLPTSAQRENAMNATVHKTLDLNAAPAAQRLDPAGQILALNAADAAHLSEAQGWTVRALDGNVWITQDGDIRDVVISAGQSFVLDRNTPALLSAFGTARISLRLETVRPRPLPGMDTAPVRPAAPQWSVA
jgi:hypothetical protein